MKFNPVDKQNENATQAFLKNADSPNSERENSLIIKRKHAICYSTVVKAKFWERDGETPTYLCRDIVGAKPD